MDGAIFIKRTRKPYDYIHFFCKCGIKDKMKGSFVRNRNTKFICKKCRKKKGPPNKLSIGDVRKIFIDSGGFPKFFSYTDTYEKLSFICFCGREDTISLTSIKKWNKVNLKEKCPLCKNCRNRNISRENSSKWNPILNQEDRAINHIGKRPKEFYKWVIEVFKLYDYKCFITGVNTDLSPHHLFAWGKYPEKRYDVSNGVPLLRSLHIEFHKLYGYGGNTLDQFKEFCKNKGVCETLPLTKKELYVTK